MEFYIFHCHAVIVIMSSVVMLSVVAPLQNLENIHSKFLLQWYLIATYLSSRKMFQLLLRRKYFYLLQRSIFLELSYVSLRYNKCQKFDHLLKKLIIIIDKISVTSAIDFKFEESITFIVCL
jgi:hypothetical protein